MEKEKQPLFSSYDRNVAYLKERLAVDKSFDVIHLDLEYAGRNMALFLIDGFAKDEILHYIMKLLAKLEPEQLEPDPLEKLFKTYIPYIEVGHEKDLNKVTDLVLGGPAALVVEGVDEIIMIDARTYPVRSPAEPDLERVTRGPRDGFVETIVFNTALTRRRVRDRSLRMEYLQIGRRSMTDVAVCYLEDIADQERVEDTKATLQKLIQTVCLWLKRPLKNISAAGTGTHTRQSAIRNDRIPPLPIYTRGMCSLLLMGHQVL